MKLPYMLLLEGIRPVPVLHETGRPFPVAGFDELDEQVVLGTVAFFPVYIVPVAGEIVQALFQGCYQAQHRLVRAEIQENTVEFEIQPVVVFVIFTFERRLLVPVELLHPIDVIGGYLVENVQHNRGLQGAQDFIVFPDILKGQLVDHHPPARKDGNETFSFKLYEGIPQGRLADAQLIADLVEIQGRAGGQFSSLHPVPKIQVDLFPQRLGIDIHISTISRWLF